MQIPDYTEIYNGDRYCLMCRHVCPVERVTKNEATSPHGWALLVASVQRGLVDWNAETVDTLYKCADCGLCRANCVTDRPLPAAIVAARASVVQGGAMPESVVQVDKLLLEHGTPYPVSTPQQGATYPVSTTKMGSIGLYVGAATAYKSPAGVEASHRLMQLAGYEPTALDIDRSGVYLPYTLGLWDTARMLAEETVRAIKDAGVSEVITLSNEDTHAFLHIYPQLGVALPEGLTVRQFSEWLWEMVEAGKLRLRPLELEGAVYHDACHTPRSPEGGIAARKLVKALTGHAPGEMFWRGRQAAPCGAVGGFEFTQPALAEALSRARVQEARQLGATAIITDDPQCASQLSLFAEGLPVINLVNLLAEQAEAADVWGLDT